jgi:hypothetical protein
MHFRVESASEEKEAKRLLQICRGDLVRLGANTPRGKSFLLLFFKKEVLPLNLSSLRAHGALPLDPVTRMRASHGGGTPLGGEGARPPAFLIQLQTITL